MLHKFEINNTLNCSESRIAWGRKTKCSADQVTGNTLNSSKSLLLCCQQSYMPLSSSCSPPAPGGMAFSLTPPDINTKGKTHLCHWHCWWPVCYVTLHMNTNSPLPYFCFHTIIKATQPLLEKTWGCVPRDTRGLVSTLWPGQISLHLRAKQVRKSSETPSTPRCGKSLCLLTSWAWNEYLARHQSTP